METVDDLSNSPDLPAFTVFTLCLRGELPAFLGMEFICSVFYVRTKSLVLFASLCDCHRLIKQFHREIYLCIECLENF
jgi:hypothetical protein